MHVTACGIAATPWQMLVPRMKKGRRHPLPVRTSGKTSESLLCIQQQHPEPYISPDVNLGFVSYSTSCPLGTSMSEMFLEIWFLIKEQTVWSFNFDDLS